MRSAFSMIELVFVIVILGILAAVAVPKLAATRTDAQIAKGRSDIASVRSAIINERQSRLITGDSTFIKGTKINDGGVFGGVLTYPLTSSTADGHWEDVDDSNDDNATYKFRAQGVAVEFTYTRSNGVFTCDEGDESTDEQKLCAKLIH